MVDEASVLVIKLLVGTLPFCKGGSACIELRIALVIVISWRDRFLKFPLPLGFRQFTIERALFGL